MQQAVVVRNATAPVCSLSVSAKSSESIRVPKPVGVSRRSLLLGMAAGVASLASNVNRARAAAPLLAGKYSTEVWEDCDTAKDVGPEILAYVTS
jgi:hypothetical protein